MMRIVFFSTSGELSLRPLCQLADAYDVVAVVRPGVSPVGLRQRLGRWARKLGLRPVDPIERFTRDRGMQSLRAKSGNDPLLISQLEVMKPDLICISTFRWLLAPEVYAIPTCGTLNLHPSLLPRHRGPVPLFWIYYHNDLETGVTVHVVNKRADAGDILCQEAFALPRGLPVEQLNHENARRGAVLLRQAVEAIRTGTSKRLPQDEALATYAPRVHHGESMVPFDVWNVERVWHFLAGLCPRFLEPLRDQENASIRYDKVLGYEASHHTHSLGSVERTHDGWNLYCLGGVIRLA